MTDNTNNSGAIRIAPIILEHRRLLAAPALLTAAAAVLSACGSSRMIKYLRLLTAIATFLPGTATPRDAPTARDQSLPAIVTLDMSPASHDAVVHSAELFAEAGLELPAVTIRRHSDKTACDGHEGISRAVGTRSEIDVCTSTSVAGLWEQRVILHELAHAWAAHHLSPARKEAFRKLRRWEYWQDYERAEWRYNGTEQAAEIIVWALSEHAIQVTQIDQNTCAELLAGYIALTGLTPLHGYTDRCDGLPELRQLNG